MNEWSKDSLVSGYVYAAGLSLATFKIARNDKPLAEQILRASVVFGNALDRIEALERRIGVMARGMDHECEEAGDCPPTVGKCPSGEMNCYACWQEYALRGGDDE